MSSFDPTMFEGLDIHALVSGEEPPERKAVKEGTSDDPPSVHDWTLLHASKGDEAMLRPLREALTANGARIIDLLHLCASLSRSPSPCHPHPHPKTLMLTV